MNNAFARFRDDPNLSTLQWASDWLRSHLRRGAYCPCCGQLAKMYRRKLNSSMAYALILIYRQSRLEPDGFFHVPSHLAGLGLKGAVAAAIRGDWAKLVHWELIEPQSGPHEGDGRTSGIWRITEKGRDFVLGHIRVESHAVIYDGQCLTLDGAPTSIRAALKSKFSYEELMQA